MILGRPSVMKKDSFLLTPAILLLAVSTVYMGACTPRARGIQPSKPLPDAGEIIRHLDDNNKKVFSLKGMANVKIVTEGKDVNVKEVLVVKRPSKIRVETIGLFGNPLFILALDGPDLSINRPAENVFYRGNISSGRIKLPFPLNEFGSEELADILTGSVSPIKYGSIAIDFSDDGNSYLLILVSPDGLNKQMITTTIKDLRLKKSETIDNEKGMALSVTFDDYQVIGDIPFPKEIVIKFVNRPDSMQINYEDIELNTDLPDELFILTPP